MENWFKDRKGDSEKIDISFLSIEVNDIQSLT
jgi:hypothetical protein